MMIRETLSSAIRHPRSPSCQPNDIPCLVHVDPLGRRSLGQTWHPDDLTGEGDEKSRSRGNLDVADGQCETLGTATELGIIGERVLGLGHANGQRTVAEFACL